MEQWNGMVEWNSEMECWNGTVEWNSGMTTPTEQSLLDDLYQYLITSLHDEG